MKVGTCGLDTELTYAFHADGTQSGLRSLVIEGERVPDALACEVWAWLSNRKAADVILEACWSESEEESE